MRIRASLICMNERQLGWDDLRVVLAVSQGGTLAAAAERLHVSHATVFRRLNQIERHLGVRLFERRRNGYTPTAAGAEVTALAGRLEHDIAALERRIAGRDQRSAGTVRITTTDTLLYGPLSAPLAAFRRAHPQIVLEVAASNTLLDLDKGEADVAIRPSRDPPQSMVGRRISAVAMAVYGSRNTKAADSGALGRYDWAVPDESLAHTPARRWLEEKGLLSRAVYRANSLFALREAARNGVGLTVLPCYLADPDPQLIRVGAPVPELQSELWLLTHPQLRRTARVKTFMDTMARLLQPTVPLFEGRARSDSVGIHFEAR
jgi:DNA-binding transcriptional LysR family regulator